MCHASFATVEAVMSDLANALAKLEVSIKRLKRSLAVEDRKEAPPIVSWADAINAIDVAWERVFGSTEKFNRRNKG